MARNWRQRLFPPDSIANDIAEHKRLRYAPWFEPARELAVRNGWSVQYEEADANLYRRGWSGVDPAVGRDRMAAYLVNVNPCQEISLEFTLSPPVPRGGCDDGS